MMTREQLQTEIGKLSWEEQAVLANTISCNISQGILKLHMTPDEEAELDQRIAESLQEPLTGISWGKIKAETAKKYEVKLPRI